LLHGRDIITEGIQDPDEERKNSQELWMRDWIYFYDRSVIDRSMYSSRVERHKTDQKG
jgi:hypothetical protein